VDDPLDEVASRLYAVEPEGFVAARGEEVARARAAGARELARRIAGLRRPTVGAWLVNLLAREQPERIGDLLELGERLRAAQRELRGEELRELSRERSTVVGALTRSAVSLAVAAGRPRASLPVAEIEATLTAALASEEVAADLSGGRLARTVSYAGFGETPRPRLTLVQGGSEALAGPEPAAAAPARPAPASRPAPAPAPTSPPAPTSLMFPTAPTSPPAPAPERLAAAAGTEPTDVDSPGQIDDGPAVRERPDEAEAAEQEAQWRRESERRARGRDASATRRRARAAAHKELLAARTELAEAEAARVVAERAVVAARRRVEAARVSAESYDDER
jgi:hypothetical protein